MAVFAVVHGHDRTTTGGDGVSAGASKTAALQILSLDMHAHHDVMTPPLRYALAGTAGTARSLDSSLSPSIRPPTSFMRRPSSSVRLTAGRVGGIHVPLIIHRCRPSARPQPSQFPPDARRHLDRWPEESRPRCDSLASSVLLTFS